MDKYSGTGSWVPKSLCLTLICVNIILWYGTVTFPGHVHFLSIYSISEIAYHSVSICISYLGTKILRIKQHWSKLLLYTTDRNFRYLYNLRTSINVFSALCAFESQRLCRSLFLINVHVLHLADTWAKRLCASKGKGVWPANAIITDCRPTHGTVRKRHRAHTTTIQQEDN